MKLCLEHTKNNCSHNTWTMEETLTLILRTSADAITTAKSISSKAFRSRAFLEVNGWTPAQIKKVDLIPEAVLEDPMAASISEQERVSKEDHHEAMQIFLTPSSEIPTPTTSGAQAALNKLLKQYDYSLSNAANRIRQYVTFKLFELAETDDPKIQLKALEMLGKVTEVGLFSTRIEVANTNVPTNELEQQLTDLLAVYSIEGAVKTPEEMAASINYSDISDEELIHPEIRPSVESSMEIFPEIPVEELAPMPQPSEPRESPYAKLFP